MSPISLKKVYIETPQIAALTSDSLAVSPSISALLAKKPGGKISAKGFLKGELEISMYPSSSANGVDKSKFEVIANNISLNEARQVAIPRIYAAGGHLANGSCPWSALTR